MVRLDNWPPKAKNGLFELKPEFLADFLVYSKISLECEETFTQYPLTTRLKINRFDGDISLTFHFVFSSETK